MKVLFVNMPFSAIRPAIGISLLKGQLERIGVSSQIIYPNMRFSQLIGAANYQYIAEIAPSQSLAGDWVFSSCLFGNRHDADAAYLSAYTQRFSRFAVGDDSIATLKLARNVAEQFLDDCLRQFAWHSFDIIGFTSTFTQHVASLALAQRLKQRFPHLCIVFGGANCEAEMGLQLHTSFPFIDYVCSGEADRSFPELVQAMRDGSDVHQIPGIISRNDGRSIYCSLMPNSVKNLDELPYPNYDDYFEQLSTISPSVTRSSMVVMETSRGCWWGQKHHCTFCGLNGMSMTFRSKSAKRVLDEILYLRQRYRAQFVEMVDNILDMRYFSDLLPELRQRQLSLGLFYETKANLTKDQVRLLREAGIAAIQPGIESFSTPILRGMRKGTSAVQNIQLLKWCKEWGVNVLWNLLFGFPGEDPTEYDATASIFDAIHHLQPPQSFGAIRLDRFSPNFTEAHQRGICNVRPDRSYKYIYDLPETELSGIAYYFEHDYQDGRDPEQYISRAFAAYSRWHQDSAGRGLVYADHGDTLAIWDFRRNATKTLTILGGPEREIYLYCDQHRSHQQIEAFLLDREACNGDVDAILDPLIEANLMIHLDSQYLSLAVRNITATSRNTEGIGLT